MPETTEKVRSVWVVTSRGSQPTKKRGISKSSRTPTFTRSRLTTQAAKYHADVERARVVPY